MKTRTRPARGAGMTEYIVIVVLVAISVLLAVKAYGHVVLTKNVGATVEVQRIDTRAP